MSSEKFHIMMLHLAIVREEGRNIRKVFFAGTAVSKKEESFVQNHIFLFFYCQFSSGFTPLFMFLFGLLVLSNLIANNKPLLCSHRHKNTSDFKKKELSSLKARYQRMSRT
jgi:hypothetical protein